MREMVTNIHVQGHKKTRGLLRNLAEDRSLDSILTAAGGGFLLLKASSCASMAEQSIEALVSLLTLMCGGMVKVVTAAVMTHCSDNQEAAVVYYEGARSQERLGGRH